MDAKPWWAGLTVNELAGEPVDITLRSPRGQHVAGTLALESEGLFTGLLMVDDPAYGPVYALGPDKDNRLTLQPNVVRVDRAANPVPSAVGFGAWTPFRADLIALDKVQLLKVLEEAAEFEEAAKTLLKHDVDDPELRAAACDEACDLLQSLANTLTVLHVSDGELAAAKRRVTARNTAKGRTLDAQRRQFTMMTAADTTRADA